MTRIFPCKCSHVFQDNLYGNGRRVHNFAEKANSGVGGFRCTVCGDVKSNREVVSVIKRDANEGN